MLKSLLVAMVVFAAVFNPLQKASQNVDIASSLVTRQGWVPYPAYADRQGWSDFLGEYQGILAAKGEKYLNYQWADITDADYLAYELSDDRHSSEDKLEANRTALSALFIAELAQGEGRFLPDIKRGVSWFCKAPSWAVVTHLAKYQKSGRALPDPDDIIIELFSGNLSQFLSWVYYFLSPQLGPELSSDLRAALQKRALDPFLTRDDFRWMGFVPVPGKKLNNWNPWCNQNILLCFMLLEDDRETLAKAVEKSIRSVDLWLNSLPPDGCCDEGTTYWYKSVGHLLDYLENLERITGGAVSLWDEPFLRRIGDYIVNADIGDCWQVNFADGTPSRRPISYWIYRYGKASGNKLMTDFAVNAWHRFGNDPTDVDWVLFYQGLEAVAACREMKALPSLEIAPTPFMYYPESDVCFVRKGKSFLAAKGGNNGERHNHNDIGTCIYFYDSTPVLIDAGVGTYEKNTFGPRRYENWFVQSGWHNLPVINGCDQAFGEEFKASGTRANGLLRSFRTDIAGAYPDSARVESWTVKYRLARKGGLKIVHRFSLLEALAPNVLHFLVAEKPELQAEGTITLSGGLQMTYDPAVFSAAVEEKPLAGLGFSARWGDALYRISLTARTLQKRGRYVIRINPMEQETIPAITERVASLAKAQYQLLDARLAPDLTPRGLNPDGTPKDCSVGSWTSGFFPGALWQLYQLTQDPEVLSMAERRTFALDSLLTFPQSHDLGFQVNCSYGNGYKMTGDPKYLPLIEQGAGALASRFNPNVGATLSWEVGEKGSAYPVIIDNMMNLELLENASRLFQCDSLNDIAVRHARTTMENHFRPDYSSYHMLDYDPATGEVLRKVTVQGYADESAWARGQAWALYGYTMMFRETGREEFLQQAEGIANYLLSRLPADGIPYWDFDDPEIPNTYRDASAGAVMCSAFIELSNLSKDRKLAAQCLAMARRQLRTLASPQYLAAPGENGGFLLKHSVGNLPGGGEIDTPLIYADYYFLEALMRYNGL